MSVEGTGRALADTSFFVAVEQERPLARRPPVDLGVSVVTIGELRAGVMGASDAVERSKRWATLEAAQRLRPLPVDQAVATQWAELRERLRETGRRMPVNDSWIAATAIAHGLPVVTQHDDYDDVPGLSVIKV